MLINIPSSNIFTKVQQGLTFELAFLCDDFERILGFHENNALHANQSGTFGLRHCYHGTTTIEKKEESRVVSRFYSGCHS